MTLQRALAVIAAVMIVCSVALATQEVHPSALGDMLADFGSNLPQRIEAAFERWFGSWAARHMLVPLMSRPAWIIPASLALVATGLALSVPRRATTSRSRRRS